MKYIYFLVAGMLLLVQFSCKGKKQSNTELEATGQLLLLESNRLKAEFSLDSNYLAGIIDSSFLGISPEGVESKQGGITGMLNKIRQRVKDSIVVDSFNLENAYVNVYDQTAVVCFVVHTHGRNKSVLTERKTRFYDVWVRKDSSWKAVASQGSLIFEK